MERQQQIIEILKSVDCTVQTPLRQRLYAGETLYGQYNVHVICDALNLSRGTFYNHVLRSKKDNTWYAKRCEELRIRIQEIYDDSKQIFGAEKIAAVHDMGITSIRQTSKKLYEDERKKHKNYLNQEFDTLKPNEVWVSDVTYFKFNENSYYICAIIDLFSRMVIGYKISKNNSTQLVKSTLKAAYALRSPAAGLIFHTDRGSNYGAKAVQDYLKTVNITHSFSRAHVPYDNSVMESSKREELYRTKYRSEAEFYKAVADYILIYNTKRPHKKIKYKTPAQKEQEFLLLPESFFVSG